MDKERNKSQKERRMEKEMSDRERDNREKQLKDRENYKRKYRLNICRPIERDG